MKKRRRSNRNAPAGLLALFGLPFFLAGLFLTGLYFHYYLKWHQTSSWEEVPCWILATDLESSSDGDGGTTYRATAHYRYHYQGQEYHSEQVTLDDSSDNIGDFHQRVHRELSKHVEPAKRPDERPSFRCYVNPEEPDEAILYRDLRWEMQALKAVFALTFPAVGAGMCIGGLIGMIHNRRKKSLRRAHPEEPWKWNPQWVGETIPERRPWMRLIFYLYTLWSGVIIWPLIVILALNGIYAKEPLAYLSFIFVVLWSIPAWFSLRHLRHRRVVGELHFEPAQLPVVTGTSLIGNLQTKDKPQGRRAIKFTLSCEKHITNHGHKNSSTSKETIWSEESAVPGDRITRSISNFHIPVHFVIPHDAPETSMSANDAGSKYDTETKYLWKLSVKFPSSPMESSFELPVFHLDATGRDATPSTHPSTVEPISINDQAAEKLPAELAACRISVERDHRGWLTTISSPPARQKTHLFSLVVFNLLWSGIAIFFVFSDAPLLFPIVWITTATGIWLYAIWYALHGRVFRCAPDTFRIENSFGPFRWSRSFNRTEIREFQSHQSYQSGHTYYHKVSLHTKNNRSYAVATMIPNSLTAETLARELNVWLG